jgi:hypothetical protein
MVTIDKSKERFKHLEIAFKLRVKYDSIVNPKTQM